MTFQISVALKSESTTIPIGANIESVSIRKDEIDASVELLENVKSLINKKI